MVRACICCKKKNNKSGEHVSLYGFPKDVALREMWINAIGARMKVCDSARVCSRHFKQEDFRYSVVGEKPFLKQGAVPSLHLDEQFQKNSQGEESFEVTRRLLETAAEFCDQEALGIQQEVMLTIADITSNSVSEECSEPFNVRIPRCLDVKELSSPVTKVKVEESSGIHLKRQRNIDDVRWEEISTSPTQAKIYWEVAVEKIQRQRTLIKTLKQKVKRLRKKVTDLRNVAKDLTE